MKVLVTGGTRGIGRAIAERLVKAGHHVRVTGTKPEGKAPERASYQACNFENSREVEKLADQVGEAGLDILINNAGINKVGPLDGYDPADFARIQQVNVTAPMLLMRAVLPGMKKRKFGRILNITSIFGVVSKIGRGAYSASKFGLYGLTRALALESARDNVLVNCLAPGFIDTDMTRGILGEKGIKEMSETIPMGRLARPEEIATFAAFLVSQENTYMTGQNVIVDGGYTCV